MGFTHRFYMMSLRDWFFSTYDDYFPEYALKGHHILPQGKALWIKKTEKKHSSEGVRFLFYFVYRMINSAMFLAAARHHKNKKNIWLEQR